MKGIVAWFAENHVAANLLMLFILLAGAVTGLTMKLEVFPETSLDRIHISMEYPGASPAEVEEAAVVRIEEAIGDITGIEQIKSSAMESNGLVQVEVEKGRDPRNLLDDIKNRVDAINTFPDEVKK